MAIPIVSSLFFYTFVFGCCELVRQIVRQIFSEGSLGKTICYEFIGTLQLCSCLFEGSLVGKYYGTAAYFLSVAGVVLAHASLKRPSVFSNPNSLIETWILNKNLKTMKFIFLLLAECGAGFCAFHLARQFWRLEFSSDHGSRYRNFACSADLTVPLAHGILYEFLATLIDRVIWNKAEENLQEIPANVVGALGVATITIIGVDYTGMYFNPILASAMTFGCKGLSGLEHCMVYWLGPAMGWIVGTRLSCSLDTHLKLD